MGDWGLGMWRGGLSEMEDGGCDARKRYPSKMRAGVRSFVIFIGVERFLSRCTTKTSNIDLSGKSMSFAQCMAYIPDPII